MGLESRSLGWNWILIYLRITWSNPILYPKGQTQLNWNMGKRCTSQSRQKKSILYQEIMQASLEITRNRSCLPLQGRNLSQRSGKLRFWKKHHNWKGAWRLSVTQRVQGVQSYHLIKINIRSTSIIPALHDHIMIELIPKCKSGTACLPLLPTSIRSTALIQYSILTTMATINHHHPTTILQHTMSGF